MKYCVDCKWYVHIQFTAGWGAGQSYYEHKCANPSGLDVVTKLLGDAKKMRNYSDCCGRDAKWYEAKEIPDPPTAKASKAPKFDYR
jgi:hypothetical protein